MVISVEIPDNIARQLDLDGPNQTRRALEMFAFEGYREERLSREQVGKLLGLSCYEAEGFLKENGAYITYTQDELDAEMQTLESYLCSKTQ